jgi:hypothetical protein
MAQHQTTFSDELEQMLKDLAGRGYSISEALKAGVRLLHRKEFPLYAPTKAGAAAGGKKPKPGKDPIYKGMSNEELCEEVLLGEVFAKQGVKYCRFKRGPTTTEAPLSAVREFID